MHPINPSNWYCLMMSRDTVSLRVTHNPGPCREEYTFCYSPTMGRISTVYGSNASTVSRISYKVYFTDYPRGRSLWHGVIRDPAESTVF